MSTRYENLGRCSCCGGPDAGHKTWDAMAVLYLNHTSLREIATHYGVTVADVHRMMIESAAAADERGN